MKARVTVRKLANLLQQMPEEYQDVLLYAADPEGILTGLYEFDPLTVEVKTHSDGERYVEIPADPPP
jgi:hypothetical protein